MKSLLLLVLLCGVPSITAEEVLAVQDAADAAPPQPIAAAAAALPDLQEENQLPAAEDVAAEDSVKGHFYRCPSGWVGYDDRCYRFETLRRTWASAEARCDSLGANLPAVHEQVDYNFLQRLTTQAGHSEAWIGGFFFQGWRWIDNTPFNFFTNPWERTPANPCLHLNANSGWSSQICEKRLGFICVRRLDRDNC